MNRRLVWIDMAWRMDELNDDRGRTQKTDFWLPWLWVMDIPTRQHLPFQSTRNPTFNVGKYFFAEIRVICKDDMQYVSLCLLTMTSRLDVRMYLGFRLPWVNTENKPKLQISKILWTHDCINFVYLHAIFKRQAVGGRSSKEKKHTHFVRVSHPAFKIYFWKNNITLFQIFVYRVRFFFFNCDILMMKMNIEPKGNYLTCKEKF